MINQKTQDSITTFLENYVDDLDKETMNSTLHELHKTITTHHVTDDIFVGCLSVRNFSYAEVEATPIQKKYMHQLKGFINSNYSF